ncbi:MAG: NAD(P)/FAD-dependent oxidoreductase [Acidobacteria bacterium]|nr:NAD(P)/FAD-dependent oxidoreductase [Acidobacteriota bacterium]
MSRAAADILIVGGGPAGLAAASAAARHGGLSVTILDNNPFFGGQIWRPQTGIARSARARRLFKEIDEKAVTIIRNAEVFAAEADDRLIAQTPAGRIDLKFEQLVLATGARERFLPFPGWALPNVMGAGGLQALVKCGLNVAGKRVVVAGTGPLLLAVGEYLRSKGALVAAIVEQANSASVYRFARGMLRSPAKLFQAAALRAKLIGIPYLADSWVTAAELARSPIRNGFAPDASGREGTLSVMFSRKGKPETIECDYLACGYHLVPNIELAGLLGCEVVDGHVAADEFQKTSIPNIFCAGEPTGIGGVEKALIEGEIAGLAASGHKDKASVLLPRANEARRFADSLNAAFALRDELKTLADDSTIVCRCEDVQYGKLKEFDNWRSAKLQARCGMGPCQGRVCGAAAEFLFGWKTGSVRPPIFPVRSEDL